MQSHHPEVSRQGASLLGIIKIWNISNSTTTNQSAWYNRLICEPRTLAHGIVSILRARLFYLKSRNWRVVDYFHIWDRASIPGHARNIFCVHRSSYGFQHSHSSRTGFISQLKNSLLLEVMFTIYLTLNRESSRTSNRRENVYIFLTPLFASYSYSRNAKRVLQKPVRETHAPIERLGRDHSMVSSPEPLGLICNTATYLRRTEHVCSKLDLK